MGHLSHVVKREMKSYAGSDTHTKLYAILDDAAQIYTVNVVDNSPQRRPARVVVMARTVDDHIVIEAVTTDRPLVRRLVEAGIPREKIILAYTGESLPENKPHRTS
ncbi:MAG: XisI protein [Anaerolineae bacterium]|nr:MAG: XisI protein [Anaerolineae bacterium]